MLSGLSVIIPFYSQEVDMEPLLTALTKSFQNTPAHMQPLIEILVIDDASPIPPSQRSLASPFHVVRLEKNRGVGYARNLGVQQAKHERFFCLDSDILVPQDFFQTVFDEIEKHGSYPIIQGYTSENSPTPQLFSRYLAITNACDLHLYKKDEHAHLLCTGCFSSTRTFFNTIGAFETRFTSSGGEEYQILARIPDRSIFQSSRIIVDHIYEDLPRRLRKVWRRSQHMSQVVIANPSCPRKLKIIGSLKVFFCGLIVLSLLLLPFIPSTGLLLFFMSLLGLLFSDGGAHILFLWKFGGLGLTLISPLFTFLEYGTAGLGIVYHSLQKFLTLRKSHAR